MRKTWIVVDENYFPVLNSEGYVPVYGDTVLAKERALELARTERAQHFIFELVGVAEMLPAEAKIVRIGDEPA